MDLSWVAAYTMEPKDFIIPALGITFTLPDKNGFNFINMLNVYKSREQFLNVLSHEMTHAGTVHFDTRRDYLETKAYNVGKGDLMLGEYAVAVDKNPRLWVKIIDFTTTAFGLPLPKRVIQAIPKIKSAYDIWSNNSLEFHGCNKYIKAA